MDPIGVPFPASIGSRSLVDRARAAGVAVDLRIHGDPSSVTGTSSRSAFRIVQESVTNVMKHAPGHDTSVVVTVRADVVDLIVEDHPSAVPDRFARRVGLGATGNGIIGMRERAAAVGGELSVGPTTDGGWRVVARLPISTGGSTDDAGSIDVADGAGS